MSPQPKPRRRGRPPKAPTKEGERIQLSLRVTPELKRMLDRTAENSGRSQSQEAEFRLEGSFQRQHLLMDVLRLAFHPQVAGILVLLGNGLRWVMDHHRAAAYMAHRLDLANVNLGTPYVYEDARKVISKILEDLQPKGDASPPIDIAAQLARIGGQQTIDSIADMMTTFPDDKTDVDYWPELMALLQGLSIKIESTLVDPDDIPSPTKRTTKRARK